MSRRGTGRHPASPWRRGQVCPGDRQRHRATCYTTEGALVTFRQAGAGVAPRNPRKPGVTRAKRDADEGCFGAETEPRVWPDALCQSQIQKRGSGTWATPCYLDPDPPSPVTNLPTQPPSQPQVLRHLVCRHSDASWGHVAPSPWSPQESVLLFLVLWPWDRST